MVYTSFDCVLSPEEGEVSMGGVGGGVGAGDLIKDRRKLKKHPVYSNFLLLKEFLY